MNLGADIGSDFVNQIADFFKTDLIPLVVYNEMFDFKAEFLIRAFAAFYVIPNIL